MSTCFLMQPFDGADFDKRCEEIFKPAIVDAGLEPYRVDQDSGASIPIESIESGIRSSRVCLADITTDNPNVWFELGYALACGKEVVMVCSKSRPTKYPFDIQHRTVVSYGTGSLSDFTNLRSEIAKRLKACLEKTEELGSLATALTPTLAQQDGMSAHEVMAIGVLVGNLNGAENSGVYHWQLRSDMESNGFTAVATNMAVRMLTAKKMIHIVEVEDQDGNLVAEYQITQTGWHWVLENQDKFSLRNDAKTSGRNQRRSAPDLSELDDDIPF